MSQNHWRCFRRLARRSSAGLAAVGAVLLLVSDAAARTAQVCPGPANPPAGCFTIDTSVIGNRPFEGYRVTNPNALLFDVASRRAEIGALGSDAGRYCAANPWAVLAETLPSLTFRTATVTLAESVWTTADGVVHMNEMANIAFTDLATSEGLSLPRFGLIFARGRGDTQRDLQFRPSVDPNLFGIPGLTEDIFINFDPATNVLHLPSLSKLPVPLRHLIHAIAYRLPSLYANATQVVVVPAADGRTVWSLAEVIGFATDLSTGAFGTPVPRLPAPIVTLTCDLLGSGYSTTPTCLELSALTEFRDFLINYGADYLATGSRASATALLTSLRSWAAANALSVYPGIQLGQPNQPDFRPKYELNWFIVPLITTWSFLRQDPLLSASDRSLVENWIDRLVAYSTEPEGGPQNPRTPFNTGYLALSVRMAWGIITGNHIAFAEGVERIYMGLHQMRGDGSFPREVSRGACALNYQSIMLLNLLFMAEMAATQGYDAYSLSADGRTLHVAVKFLLDAVDDVSVVAGYAYATIDPNSCWLPPGSPMILETIREVGVSGGRESALGHGFVYSAWLEPYLRRFPSHPNSPRLSALLVNGLEANRSIYHPHSGGNTTCFSAGLAPALVAAVLPGSRSVQVGVPATAFATIINAGVSTATGVRISVNTSIPALFTYQTTDPATNTTTEHRTCR